MAGGRRRDLDTAELIELVMELLEHNLQDRRVLTRVLELLEDEVVASPEVIKASEGEVLLWPDQAASS